MTKKQLMEALEAAKTSPNAFDGLQKQIDVLVKFVTSK